MKLSFLKERLTQYDSDRSFWRKATGFDPAEVTTLKQLVNRGDGVDRDLTPEELYRVFVLLLPPSQASQRLNPATQFLFNTIRSNGGPEYQAAVCLYHAKPSLFNKENYLALMQHRPHHLQEIMDVWDKLPPQLHTQESLELLQVQVNYLDIIINLLGPAQNKEQLIQGDPRENFFRLCFKTMLSDRGNEFYNNLLNGPIKDFPRNLLTLANLKRFKDVYLASKSQAQTLRVDILESVAALSARFNQEEMQEIFECLCAQKERNYSVLNAQFPALPKELQTVENVKRLVSIKFNYSLISTFNSLATPLQTNENFARLVATAGNSETNDVFTYVYEAWNRLPSELQTQANFTAMHINSDKYGSIVYRSIEFFENLEQKTQENFTKLFSFKIDSINSRHLREFPDDLFYRIPAADFVNLGFDKIIRTSIAWKLLPQALKTDATLSLLKGPSKDKEENAAAVRFLFPVLPEALRTEENFNQIIANAQPINRFRAEPSFDDLFYIFARIGTVVDQALFNRIIQVAKNLVPEETSTLVKQFNAIDYGFRFVPPWLRGQENLRAIVERTDRIQIFRATPQAQELSTVLYTLPQHLFTQGLFNLVIQLTEATNQAALDMGLNRIRGHVNRILNQVAPQIPRGGINVAQSTHTASVHKSVSESAIRLMNRYGDQIDTGKKLDEVIENLKEWISYVKVDDLGLNDEKMSPEDIGKYKADLSHQLEAAKRAVVTLSNPVYAFTDPESQVSTRQLMALVWIAIQDDGLRTSPRQDANRKMIVGLYDVQRGYNQTEDFTDANRNATDSSICTGGTFNKLIEIPWGIHPDVQLRYLTTLLASNKIPAATRALVREYIKELQQSKSDKADVVEQISKLNTDGIEVIWEEKIKPKLATLMYDEYGSLYKGEKDQAFLDLIETGQYVDLSTLHLERYLEDPKYEAQSEESGASTPVAEDGPTAAAAPSEAVDSTASGNDSSYQKLSEATSSSSSKMGFFASSNGSQQESWLGRVGNELEKEISAFQEFDPKLKADLLGLRQLAKQLDKNELGMEHIGKLERNISRLIKDVRPHCEQVSLAQDAYQQCLVTLVTINNEVAERKQTMTNNPAGQGLQ